MKLKVETLINFSKFIHIYIITLREYNSNAHVSRQQYKMLWRTVGEHKKKCWEKMRQSRVFSLLFQWFMLLYKLDLKPIRLFSKSLYYTLNILYWALSASGNNTRQHFTVWSKVAPLSYIKIVVLILNKCQLFLVLHFLSLPSYSLFLTLSNNYFCGKKITLIMLNYV